MINLPDKVTQRAQKSFHLARSAFRVGSNVFGGRIEEARLPADYSPQPTDDFVAAAYFSAEVDSAYQLEQWVWPFEQLAQQLRDAGYSHQPFGIIVRSAHVAKHLRSRTTLPVRFSRLTKGLDAFMSAPSLRVVFYVNQSTGNFQALRFPKPAHVHLSHGESEKISMISNQLKAYDYVFTAGRAARNRIEQTLFGLDEDRMIDVGRPQLDRPREVPQVWRDFDSDAPAGKTVFYAPTWEGDSPAMAYGTLADNGRALVTTMLDAGYRVIFRPHPRTGILKSAFERELDAVQDIIRDHPRGFLDQTPDVSWQFEAADLALAEMSSVAFDWLATRQPLVMIAPHNPAAEVLAGGLLDRCPLLEPGAEAGIAELLRTAGTADREVELKQISFDYLGDTEPGTQLSRFVGAAESVIGSREAAMRSRRAA
ncbi:CDP-glycerol glycerophosphotransferase family protein [Brevibacterium aurantiacum]|uniref:CDP-glycerol glycerophosphotransferase family protein n=1 Tax=Brevibacterium aurantiacum TaxID=273384 RepID=UPI000F643EB9|nr:CDP-glycerol glycerophosphotransferase family protein [Brevibacterium aurantiacum]AZL06719.1 hypothetical protein CXR24_14895 [Brevibacterium aurantiacum]